MGTWTQKDADSRSEDSTLVVDDALGTSYIRKSSIKPLSAEVHAALLRLRALGVSFDIDHIARANNKVADALAKTAAEGRPQRGDATIPGVDDGPNPRVQERTWRWQLNGKQCDITPFTVSGARQLLQARTWPGNAAGKQTTINPTRWTPPEWPVTRPTLSGRMWATTWRNMWSNKSCSREKIVMWRLAHGALPLPPMGRARRGCLCCQGGWVETAHLFQCPATAGARYWIHHLLSSWHGSILPPITVPHWLGASVPREISKMPKPNIALWHSIRVLFVSSLWTVYGKTLAQHRQQTPQDQADDPSRHAAGDVLSHFHTKLRLEMKMQWRRARQPALVTKRKGTATRAATGEAVFWLAWGRNGVFLQAQPTGEDATPTLRLTSTLIRSMPPLGQREDIGSLIFEAKPTLS